MAPHYPVPLSTVAPAYQGAFPRHSRPGEPTPPQALGKELKSKFSREVPHLTHPGTTRALGQSSPLGRKPQGAQ